MLELDVTVVILFQLLALDTNVLSVLILTIVKNVKILLNMNTISLKLENQNNMV
jgi:hypothetical protein